jgi:hypothetical protein
MLLISYALIFVNINTKQKIRRSFCTQNLVFLVFDEIFVVLELQVAFGYKLLTRREFLLVKSSAAQISPSVYPISFASKFGIN